MSLWIEKNKRFFIGYLATITTTILWAIYHFVSLQRNKSVINELVDVDNIDKANEVFTRLVVTDFLLKFMIGVSVVYSLLFIVKIFLSFIKLKFRKVEEI